MKALVHFLKIDWIKTVYFNFKLFRFKVFVRLPIFLYYGVKIGTTTGGVFLNFDVKPGVIKFRRNCKIEIAGKVVFYGRALIGENSSIHVSQNGILHFGNNFSANKTLTIYCQNDISFGDNCMVSWDVNIIDTDFHKIFRDGEIINFNRKVSIGNNVWIGFGTSILKGTLVADNVIIGANSLLVGAYITSFSIYAGNPAKLLKTNVTWQV